MRWSRFVEVMAVIAITGSLIGIMLPGSDFDLTHRYPPAGRPLPGMARVAGEYYHGNGRGSKFSLSILADGRYSFIESGCTGVHQRESGRIRESDGQFVLVPSGRYEPLDDRTFVLVRWDRRRYLIPPDDLEEFRDALIEGREPRDGLHGHFYVREPMAPASGLPDFPPEWAAALRRQLLLGKVVEVSAVGLAKIGRVKVDLGAKDRLRQGDFLTVQRRGDFRDRRFAIVSVEEGACLAVECSPGASESPLEVGQAVLAVRPEEKD